jgi:hypothetical protein
LMGISATTRTYAGGDAGSVNVDHFAGTQDGGIGGSGGGGDGGDGDSTTLAYPGVGGTPSSGGGGGGGAFKMGGGALRYNGGLGGTGIVLIRYIDPSTL